jgi:hypothetical protein
LTDCIKYLKIKGMNMGLTVLTDKSVLKQLKFKRTSNKFIYVGKQDKEILKLLEEAGYIQFFVDYFENEESKERFVQSYLDLIGSLGSKYYSLCWWSTFTSSKNKFASTLFQELLLLHSVSRCLDNADDDLLLINPPTSVLQSLIKYCQLNYISFKIIDADAFSMPYKIKNFFVDFIMKIFLIFKTWYRIILAKWYFRNSGIYDRNSIKEYYVLRSWFYERSINNNHTYKDSFFGVLPSYLSQKKELLIIAGIIGDYRATLYKIKKNKEFLILPQEYFADFLDPVRSIVNVIINKVYIKSVDFMGIEVSDLINFHLREDYIYTAAEECLQKYYIEGLVNKFKINTFTTTFENNPWEKVCFMTLKQKSPKTKLIGYQHAVLSPSSLNMFVSSHEKKFIPLPDRIITTGRVTKDMLEKYGQYDPDILKEGCALRFEYLYSIAKKERKVNHTILVTPEGVLAECVNLFNFIYESLKDCNKIDVIFRSHPALPFESFQKYLLFDVNDFPHFHLSINDSLKDDLFLADILVYRGSSTSIEALKTGLPIIYVSTNELLSVDPLFECEFLKWKVITNNEFVCALKEIYNLDEDTYNLQWKLANLYLNKYISPITNDKMNTFFFEEKDENE